MIILEFIIIIFVLKIISLLNMNWEGLLICGSYKAIVCTNKHCCYLGYGNGRMCLI